MKRTESPAKEDYPPSRIAYLLASIRILLRRTPNRWIAEDWSIFLFVGCMAAQFLLIIGTVCYPIFGWRFFTGWVKWISLIILYVICNLVFEKTKRAFPEKRVRKIECSIPPRKGMTIALIFAAYFMLSPLLFVLFWRTSLYERIFLAINAAVHG